jgi:hypothetical protein
MSPDEVCERYSRRSVGLSLRLMPDGEGEGTDLVLIEARPEGLRVLAELLIAVADDARDDGFQIGPRGAGNFHFAASSELGVYLHRLD